VGVDEPAADAAELVLLEDAGVVVRRVHLPNGPVFENIDRDGHRRQRWLSKSAGVGAEMLPEAWRPAQGWIFGPVAGEIDPSWAQVPGDGARIGVGWQGMLRSFEPTGWVERVDPVRSELLKRAGLVCASVDDLSPEADLRDLRRLVGDPGAAMVLTDGARGGMALDGAGLIRYDALTASVIADPTGAGDVFLAALMTAWLLTGELVTSRNLRFAAAAGSLAVEGVGLAGVPSRSEVAARLRYGTRVDRSRP
jgi:sugar/nucleoside kinase (ribokinase family)